VACSGANFTFTFTFTFTYPHIRPHLNKAKCRIFLPTVTKPDFGKGQTIFRKTVKIALSHERWTAFD
jgi:hypothetical protein